MNTIFAATTSPFLKPGKETDKNENQNLFLNLLAGKMPSACIVFNGTQAMRQDVYAGGTYLFNAIEGTPDPQYGRQFSLVVLGTLSVMDCIDVVGKLGEPKSIDVSVPEVVPENVPD